MPVPKNGARLQELFACIKDKQLEWWGSLWNFWTNPPALVDHIASNPPHRDLRFDRVADRRIANLRRNCLSKFRADGLKQPLHPGASHVVRLQQFQMRFCEFNPRACSLGNPGPHADWAAFLQISHTWNGSNRYRTIDHNFVTPWLQGMQHNRRYAIPFGR